jgi:hypothetical protein
MPERIFAIYNYLSDEAERAEQAFLDAGLLDIVLGPEPFNGFRKVELSSEEVVRRLMFAASAQGIKAPIIQRALYPTKKELRAAPLLYVYAAEHHNSNGHPRKGTTYDDSAACAECGAGLRQTSPLMLRKSEVPKRGLSGGVGDEFLFHESVADVMAAGNLRGIRFLPVLDTNAAELPWRQLVVEHEMPPMALGTRGVIRGRTGAEQPCTKCGRDGYFGTTEDPFIPAYPAYALPAMPDAAWTAERFSTGAWANPIHGKRSLADRRLIMRPAAYALLEPLKLRGLRWSPVRVI